MRWLPVPIALAMLVAAQQLRDPAGWGNDHVGKPVPEYVTGDECLFCHRAEVGSNWPTNRHNVQLRRADADARELAKLTRETAGQVGLLLGGKHALRFLKPSKDYGKLELLSAEKPEWDAKTFADRCAGCHATAVDPKTRAFASASLDCYTCHGDVPLEHSKKAQLAHLAKKSHDSAAVVTSICAQCHVRTGKSKSTGLPYPNNFVAGDNLFRDFAVDFDQSQIARLNPADRHVLENIRDVVLLGKEDVTCLTCHDVHKESTKKHHRLAEDASCQTCHNATGPKKKVKQYENHSTTCQY